MNTFYFLETDREFIFNITSFLRIMRQLHVIMITILIGRHTQTEMPLQTRFFPILIPLTFCARAYEELHFHLLKLTHTENELTGNNLVTESLTYLCNTKWHFHTRRFLHIQKIHENTLSCFWTQVNLIVIRIIRSNSAKLCFKHQVKLTNICPVNCATYRTSDFMIQNHLL